MYCTNVHNFGDDYQTEKNASYLFTILSCLNQLGYIHYIQNFCPNMNTVYLSNGDMLNLIKKIFMKMKCGLVGGKLNRIRVVQLCFIIYQKTVK